MSSRAALVQGAWRLLGVFNDFGCRVFRRVDSARLPAARCFGRLRARRRTPADQFGAFARGARRADDDQAEWRAELRDRRRTRGQRESTPILSPATVTATEPAIQNYQNIVARGGWNPVPRAANSRSASSRKAVQALRQRLIASGDLDQIAGQGAAYDSFVEAAVKRFQARHGI